MLCTPPRLQRVLMKVEASSSCFENRESGVIEVEQAREECEERVKKHPYIGWAREEPGVDVGLGHRRLITSR